MDKTMKAAVCRAPGELAIERRELRVGPAAGEVRVAVSHVGICGTDYHIYEGKHPFLEYPRIMGHEFSGSIAAVGDGVAMKVGARVLINPYVACGHCIACRKQKPNCCVAIKVLGVHVDGAMCEAIDVPSRNIIPAAGLSTRDAAMVEFLAIGAHAVRRSQAQRGARALVVGAGPIGLGLAIFARIAGLNVTLLDLSRERLAFASTRLGFEATVEGGDGAFEQLGALTGGEGFDVVFDATGAARSIEAGFAHVAHGGVYVLVSVVKDQISFADPEFHKREMMLIGSRNATHEDFETVIAAIRNGAAHLDALATHETTLDRVARDLPIWAHEKTGLVKAIVRI
jgi:2-desacetyl-2-hydroxyethyl bacteriochlorophyllide A dehydrogenase